MLVKKAGLNPHSKVLDVGCGAGKVLVCAALGYGIKHVLGVEMVAYRVHTARAVLNLVQKKLPDTVPALRNIQLLHSPVQTMNSWKGVTHVYSFDLGIPESVYSHLLRLWTESPSCQYLVSYRPPRWLWKCGFDLDLLDKMRVKQRGTGGSSHTAYVYQKKKVD